MGSSGSIGRQTLDVAAGRNDIEISALAVNSNISMLEEQVRRFRPRYAAVFDPALAKAFKDKIKDLPVTVVTGIEGLEEIACMPEVDMVVTAVSGAVGLRPTVCAVKAGKKIALANKETLVAAGKLVMELAQQHGASIIPVDSEHSAIFQCLHEKDGVDKIILTASGGPFFGRPREALIGITPEQALKHPNWNMGKKISIDSATMMNKGLEVIEAHWLFGVDYEQIEVVIHPQSIIHSAVSFVDGSILAHLGIADMHIPIQYAFSHPQRWPGRWETLDLTTAGPLTFAPPDTETFPALRLAYEAGSTGGTMPAVLNAANEIAVAAFLDRKIGFVDIPVLIEKVMAEHQPVLEPTLQEILDTDAAARSFARQFIETGGW